MLLIDWPIGAVVHRDLVFMPDLFVGGVPALSIMLFVNRPIGAVADRHLIFLPYRFVGGVLALAIVLLVDRPADRILANGCILFPNRLASGVAILAAVLLIYRFANRVMALAHHRLVDRPVARFRVLLDNRLIANSITNLRHAALFGTTAPCRIATRSAMRRLGRTAQLANAGHSGHGN
jgi:hypothetical protein